MIETLFTLVDNIVRGNITSMVGVFSSTLAPLLGACVILYALYLAYQSLYEPQNLVIMESMKFIGSLAAVTTVALNTSWYLANIVPAVLGSGDQIAQALLGTTGGGGASLQAMFDEMVSQIQAIFSSINIDMGISLDGIGGFDTLLDALLKVNLMFLVFLGFVPFISVATAYLLVAKVMVSFLLIVGPLFIMMAFFPSTRDFFKSWTGQCFNYTLLSIMYPVAFTLFVQILNQTVFAGNISLATNLMTVIVFAALILLSVQIPTFCSTLSGGIGINGLVGGMLGGVGALMKGGKGAMKGGKSAWGGAKAAGGWAKNLSKGKIKPG